MLPPHLSHLPPPSADAEALSNKLQTYIRSVIAEAGGWITFARYMELALYAPGLGYYSAGSAKLGASGDFVTAPEISPLFARCLAREVAPIVALGDLDILEVGAGSGALASQILHALEALGALPRRYLILEVSADLRERQRSRIEREVPHLAGRVQWLDGLPATLDAVVIANEVLDAIATHRVRKHHARIDEIGVSIAPDGAAFVRSDRPAAGRLLAAAAALHLPDDYETEINLAARAFVQSLAARISRGAMILIDYGYTAAEYYHPQRTCGTLMCHYRHHAHEDALSLTGLQDITAHVDFSALAQAAREGGLEVLGYANQAQFLVNCGITEVLGEEDAEDVARYAPRAAEAQKLLSPAEMGELFKVLAVGRGVQRPLLGFAQGDRSHTL
ncbi:MAG TPA: SAM-dependent methyltransferase [Burkholderiales bacterium]|nr:SAM-dependent methyltransferase [Burkholderiales bacterium]